MAKDINYRGSFLQKMFTALEQNEDMTLGEIMYSFLHKDNLNGKHFWHGSDEEIYTALENFTKFGLEQDEPLDEQAFTFWREKQQFGLK